MVIGMVLGALASLLGSHRPSLRKGFKETPGVNDGDYLKRLSGTSLSPVVISFPADHREEVSSEHQGFLAVTLFIFFGSALLTLGGVLLYRGSCVFRARRFFRRFREYQKETDRFRS